MAPKKILVFVGHPDKKSLSFALADAYEYGARQAGHEVERINVGELTFDPILRGGYKGKQPLEEDLVKFQNTLAWSDHVAMFYPYWWGDMPALMRGIFDRAFLPGYAFKYTGPYQWKRLLRGRSAGLYPVCGSHPWLLRLFGFGPGKTLRRSILHFSGFAPIRTYAIWSNPHGFCNEDAQVLFNKMEKRGASAL